MDDFDLWLADLAAGIDDETDRLAAQADLVALASTSGEAAAALAWRVVRIAAERARMPADFDRIAGGGFALSGARLAMALGFSAMGASLAGVIVTWPDRRSALAARSRLATMAEAAAAPVGAAFGADGLSLVSQMSNLAARLISDRAATLAPVVRVETGLSLPSTVLAFRLHGDAAKAGDLAAFAGSITPMIMPTAFDAIAGA